MTGLRSIARLRQPGTAGDPCSKGSLRLHISSRSEQVFCALRTCGRRLELLHVHASPHRQTGMFRRESAGRACRAVEAGDGGPALSHEVDDERAALFALRRQGRAVPPAPRKQRRCERVDSGEARVHARR